MKSAAGFQLDLRITRSDDPNGEVHLADCFGRPNAGWKVAGLDRKAGDDDRDEEERSEHK